MSRFNLSNGRYTSPPNSKYAFYIEDLIKKGNDGEILLKNEKMKSEVHGTYGALILHPKWKARRKEILQRDGNACVICKATSDLQVHHRQYHFILATKQFKPPWEYSDNLLITLCIKCHQRGHSKFKVPTINI